DKELTSNYSNPNGSLACPGALTDQNPLNRARYARLRAALSPRSTAVASLPAGVQDAIMTGTAANPGAGHQRAGYMCLPWANALHNAPARDTFQENEEKEWSGTLKAAYRWSENVMTYLSAARGYKGGGFNLDRVQTADGDSASGAG